MQNSDASISRSIQDVAREEGEISEKDKGLSGLDVGEWKMLVFSFIKLLTSVNHGIYFYFNDKTD